MESPVRICLGAAIVVNLLLLCNAPAEALALPNDITPTTVKDDRPSRFKANATWPTRSKPKTPDETLNELTPKDSTSEEHTEKNAKYKDRGRVRFGSRVKSSTPNPKRNRATSSTETATLVIVTPTPEVKKPTQIMDSMRNYKRTKMPVLASSTPVSEKAVGSKEEDSFEKFTSDKYNDNFFTIPSFDEDHNFDHDSDESSSNKVKKDNRGPSYKFPNYSKEDTYNFKDEEPFKSSFFDFDSELTTPKNDFFDKKYQKISSSIIKKLDTMKAKSSPPNITNVHKIVKENIGLERLSNNTPSNKSSVYIKNTKEIRLSDNEGASSVNKELSDMHGTSIYYEMSVLSTETYTMNHSNEDDCDDSSPSETTTPTKPTTEAESTKPSVDDPKPESLSPLPTNYLPVTNIVPFFSTVHTIPYSTQGSISSTVRITKLFPNHRYRSYSKRLNLTGNKDSPNSVTPKTEGTLTVRPHTRKFHHTTPRTKPVWMSPRRNVTRAHVKSTSPKTIYSEHFSIKDKFAPTKPVPVQPNKSLTTVSSSEIDPVLQTDVSGTSKIVHSQIVTDNTIPSLRKRGSMKFKASTASSAEVEADIADLEMPSTAWALASLISPPSLPSTVVNATENELQKVGEVIDKKETNMDSTTTSTVSSISNDIITKKVAEVDNKLPPFTPTSPSTENKISTDIKERLPAESNISLKSSAEFVTTEAVKDNALDAEIKPKEVKPLWLPPTVETATTTEMNQISNETIPPVDGTRSTGHESITKLPADVTTPQDEAVASSEVNQTLAVEKPKVTTDFEITTIRFGYVPTEATEDTTDVNTIETTTEKVWDSVMPTRTKPTTVEDSPITTYRPKYMTTTEIEETTTTVPDTTPVLEVSSQIIANVTEHTPVTTENTVHTTEVMIEPEVTTEIIQSTETVKTTEPEGTPPTLVPITTEKETVEPSTVPTTEATQEDTTKVVFEVVTEINTEKSTFVNLQTTETITSSEDTYTSQENSHSNEINYDGKTQEPKIDTTTPAKQDTTEIEQETDAPRAKIDQTTTSDERDEITTEIVNDVTKAVSELEDLTTYGGEMTTESSPRGPEEAGSGAAIAIAVSTIGVIALVLLIGLLLVVRRRGRRGVYAQRCTPVSLDAYSLDSVSVGHKGNQRLRASKRSYGNPAYDDEVTSHPMQYSALANFALDVDSITAEFAEIPSVTVRGEEVPPGCEDKNRYSNVLPLPETRVPLKRLNNDPTTEYINASFVTGPGHIKNYYILAQAPLSNTVVDFWRMIWEQNSRLVVMLTEYMENGVEKCYEYLPPSEISDNKRTFGDFKIILKKRDQRDKYAVSSIQLINMATRTWREITHLWYFWPAKGVPEDYDSVIDFLFEMRSYMKVAQTAKEYDEEGVEVIYGDQNRSSFSNLSKLREENGSNGVNVYSPAKAEEQMRRANNGTLSRMKAASEVEGIRPCVVTCASGAGRAAALAALDVTSRALAAAAADVPRAARALRAQRPHALSNRHHYIWLYKVLSEYGNKIMGGGDTI